jgi:hypothetical protein
MRRWYCLSGLAIVLLLAIVLDLYGESQVGSAEIGRDTMKMYRQKQTGQTELTPRRVQSSAAPKRTFQEQQAAAEAAAQPAPDTAAQTTPAIEKLADATTEPKPAETAMVPAVTATEPKPAAVAGQTAKDELLALLPDSTIACARVNNLDYTLALIDQYLMGIAPIPMVATIGVRTGLAQITQDQNLQAINTGGNLALVVLPPAGQGDPQAVLLTPFKGADSAAALKAANIIAVPDTAFGIKALTPAPLSADAFKGQSLQPALTARQLDETATAPIWLYVNLPKAVEFVAPMAEAKMKEQAAANPQLKSAIDQTEQIKQIGKEIQCLSVSIYPSGPMLTLDMDLIPAAGSKFGASLNKQLFDLQPKPEMDPITRGMVTMLQSMKVKDPSAVKEEAIAGIRNSDKADFVGVFSVPELIANLVQIISQAPGQQQSAMQLMMVAGIAQQMGTQIKSKMAMAFTVQENALNIQIAIPKKHVVELVQAVKAMQQNMNQAAPQGAATPPAMKPMKPKRAPVPAEPNQPAGARK